MLKFRAIGQAQVESQQLRVKSLELEFEISNLRFEIQKAIFARSEWQPLCSPLTNHQSPFTGHQSLTGEEKAPGSSGGCKPGAWGIETEAGPE
jgi:hypothetical protein